MSGAAIIKTRINELAVFVKSGEPLTADKKKEFAAKWDLSQRMVERYYKKEAEETLNDNSKRDFNDIEETAKKMHRKVLSAISKLCAIANGEYESEKIVYARNEPKVITCKPSIKEQLQAMKLLKEYEELFIMIKETQEETAKKLHRKIFSAVSKLCAIANGEYESDKIMYAHNEPKVITCKPSIKEQLQAMKLLKEYEELFIMIKETQEESFERMLKLIQKGKR